MDPQIVEVLKGVTAVAGTVLTGALGLAVAAIPLVAPFVPVLVAVARKKLVEANGEHAAVAFDAVEKALLPGVNAALAAMDAERSKAIVPDSDGGTVITEAERDAILKAGADAIVKALDSQRLLQAAEVAFGGNAALQQNIRQRLKTLLVDDHGVKI